MQRAAWRLTTAIISMWQTARTSRSQDPARRLAEHRRAEISDRDSRDSVKPGYEVVFRMSKSRNEPKGFNKLWAAQTGVL
jgi:hypothetical protein